jgi:hypothetical protein
VDNLKMMIRMNQIKNCPVTITDVTNATKIWGPDLGALKGKTTRRTPPRVRQDEIDIPPELKARFDDVILCVDLMYAQGIPILSTIDKMIRFRGVVPMKGKKAKQMYEALDVVLRQYNKAGITIKEICCDREFRPLFEHLADDMDIRLNCCTTNEHIPEAERNNRTIGERMRCIHHGFPFKMVPKQVTTESTKFGGTTLNMFPAKGGISAHYSPHTILTGQAIDFKKHLAIPFGSYVQANNENDPSNTNAPRTLDCIYLGPVMDNRQGGHKLLHLGTGKVITRPRVKEITPSFVPLKTWRDARELNN